jgi:hypothetical protein
VRKRDEDKARELRAAQPNAASTMNT